MNINLSVIQTGIIMIKTKILELNNNGLNPLGLITGCAGSASLVFTCYDCNG